jgi:hypothetical protein|uniref:4-hydroxy-3-methylbut-2-en-1-yl diphosphate synthase n=1 Tax=Siphoviridae sp. ctg6Y13 TaxID=2826419 RepID=A0A8S5QYU6_9CAUD|nr:MAG TPA: 4-hydroxy-3-methylbut-2-en-1-yl diphosphate synthase [Siphoviridae sp. ctg6Y13]
MEKLRLPKKIMKNEKDYGVPIRIRSSTHSLLDIVSNETGWSKVDVITKMVEFAFDNIEWIPSEEYVKDNGGR